MTDQPDNPEAARSTRIAALNDNFRKTARGDSIVFTATLAAEGPLTLLELLEKVRAYDDFTAHNDPSGEHEFGAFKHPLSMGGAPRPETILWKIDTYADASLTYAAEDKDAPTAVRVLTILHASDY